MYLRVALGAIGVKRLGDAVGTGRRIDAELQTDASRRVQPVVAGVAPQAEERRRLPQQVVGHGAVRLMADAAVLPDRRVLEGERPLLLRVALVAQQVDGRLLEVVLISVLPVRIVAIGADHLAFLDRVMRRQAR